MSLRNYTSGNESAGEEFRAPAPPQPQPQVQAQGAAAALDAEPSAQRIRARDGDALRGVVRGYLEQLLKASRGAGLGASEAEEVVQETFRTFVETADRFEGRSKVRTWLFGILYRKLSEARRALGRQRRFQGLDDVADEIFDARFGADGGWSRPPATPAEEFERGELRREIGRCLETSPLPQRMAFVLREIHGLETDEICQILDVDRNHLGVMLYRLRSRTRDCLEAKGLGMQRTGGVS